MLNAETDYTRPALEAVLKHVSLPSDIEAQVRRAISVIDSHGGATTQELAQELGKNWVIARRTKKIVKKYGEDVKCYSPKQFEKAERTAINKRFSEAK